MKILNQFARMFVATTLVISHSTINITIDPYMAYSHINVKAVEIVWCF